MAEAPNLYSESLEKLDQELTCPICRKHFEEPKVLQCCHYYCLECIVQMRVKRTTFSAPNVVRKSGCQSMIRRGGSSLVPRPFFATWSGNETSVWPANLVFTNNSRSICKARHKNQIIYILNFELLAGYTLFQ